MEAYLLAFYWLFFLPALLLFFFVVLVIYLTSKFNDNDTHILRVYPLLGHLVEIIKNRNRMVLWTAEIVNNASSATFLLRLPRRRHPHILTANPANVKHILKTRFEIYHKHRKFRVALRELCGYNIFLEDGQYWRKLRQLAVHEFNSRSFHKFLILVPEIEISNRLLPILSEAAASANNYIDLQHILHRFTYDVAFRTALGHDLAYLSNSPNFPPTNFADAYQSAYEISLKRNLPFFTAIWKAQRFFNMGSERRLREDISEMREFIREIITNHRKMIKKGGDDADFISSIKNNDPEGKYDDEFLIDAAINFLVAAQDTILVSLIWYFWSVSKNPDVEEKIVEEIREKKDNIRDMIYTHASIYESLRLHPPVPFGGREATEDDVLPDGTEVNKGTFVIYHTYAMGRSPELWGSDWSEFRPERWLREEKGGRGKWAFVPRDSFTYPVFHGGPRICLGKDIALMQIKTIVVAVLSRFRLVPAMEEDREPVFLSHSALKMTNGFLVKVVSRS